MILFLDDTQARHDFVTTIIPPGKLIQVYTAQQAIDALSKGGIDAAFLDHDLDETDPSHSGLVVAQFIALHLDVDKRPKTVIIHSHNPEGAKAMMLTLMDSNIGVKCLPFSTGK